MSERTIFLSGQLMERAFNSWFAELGKGSLYCILGKSTELYNNIIMPWKNSQKKMKWQRWVGWVSNLQ